MSRNHSCFNPRPAPESGAANGHTTFSHFENVSIRAPLLRAGRQAVRLLAPEVVFVSIRAPLLRAGRHKKVLGIATWKKSFNPRPAPESGAAAMHAAISRRSAVSIRAPLLRAGRRRRDGAGRCDARVSIRAPLLRAGRRVGVYLSVERFVFQSAPRS